MRGSAVAPDPALSGGGNSLRIFAASMSAIGSAFRSPKSAACRTDAAGRWPPLRPYQGPDLCRHSGSWGVARAHGAMPLHSSTAQI